LLYRKIFGDDTKSTTETTQKLWVTTKTTYRLMMKQAGSGMGEEGQVCLGICLTEAKLLTMLQDTPLNHTFPRWTQCNMPKLPGGQSFVSYIAQIYG